MMDGIVLPPSPNWYGTSLADSSADGVWAAYAAHNAVVLLRPGEHRVAHMLSGHTNRVTAVAFVPAAPADATAHQLLPLPQQAQQPQQQRLVSGGADKTLRLWEAGTRRTLKISRRLPSEVMCLAVTRDGAAAVAGCRGGELAVWAISGERVASKPAVHQLGLRTSVCAVAVSPVNAKEVALGVADGSVLLCDIAAGAVTARLSGFRGDVQSLAWGRFRCSASEPPELAPSDGPAQPGGTAKGAPSDVTASQDGVSPAQPAIMPLAADGRDGADAADAAAAADDAAGDGAELAQPAESTTVDEQAALDIDGQRTAAPLANAAAELQAVQATAAEALQQPEVWCDLLAAGGRDGTVQIWDCRSFEAAAAAPGNALQRPQPQRRHTLTLPKPGGLSAAQAGRVWVAAAWAPQQLQGCSGQGAEAQLVCSGLGGSLLVWSVPLSPGAVPAVLPPPTRLPQHHTRSVFSIDFGTLRDAVGGQPSAADQSLAAEGHSSVTGQPSAAIAGGVTTSAAATAAVTGTAAAQPLPLGMLTTSMDRSAALWRLGQLPIRPVNWKTAKVEWQTVGLGGNGYAVAAQPSSGAIAIGCGDRTVRLWRPDRSSTDGVSGSSHDSNFKAAAAAAELQWQGIPDSVTAVAWHPEASQLLAVGCSNGAVALLDVGTGVATPFLTRHKAPIVEVTWQQHLGPEGPKGGATLHSLCAAGCLLRWGTTDDKELPATSCKPVDVGGLLVAGSSTAVAAAPDQLSAVAFSPRGCLAYGDMSGTVGIAHPNPAGSFSRITASVRRLGGGAAISALAWRPVPLDRDDSAAPGPDVAALEEDREWLAVAADDGSVTVVLDNTWALSPAVSPITAHTGAEAALAVAWSPEPSTATLVVACSNATIQVFGIVKSEAGEPTLQHLRTLRGHAGRVRSLVWKEHHSAAAAECETASAAGLVLEGSKGEAATSSRAATGLPDDATDCRAGAQLSMIVSGSEDQTVRAWTLDLAQLQKAAPAAAGLATVSETAAPATAAVGDKEGAVPRQQAAAQSLELPAPEDADLTAAPAADQAAEASVSPAAAPAEQQRQQQQQQQQRATLQRSPSLSDGMSAASSGGIPAAGAPQAEQPQQQQQQQPQRQPSESSSGQPLGGRAPSGKLPSAELDTLSAVAAASPGRLRYGGMPPQQHPAESPSPSGPCSATRQPGSELQQPSSTSVQPLAASPAAASMLAGFKTDAQPGSAAAEPHTSAAGAAASPMTAAAAASPGSAGPSGGKRGRNAKAPSLGARPLPLGVQPPQQARAAALQPATAEAALAACLRLSAGLSHAAGGNEEFGGEASGGGAGGSGGSTGQAQDASHALLQGWGLYEGPIEAAAALQAAAATAVQAPASAEQAHQAAVLQLWAGDAAAALQTVLAADVLTADFVNMTIAAGREAWQAAVTVYAAQLEVRGEPQMAASQLVAAGDVRGALAVLRRAGLVQEAAALGAARLMPGDPDLQEVQRLWGAQLEAAGAFEAAACCFLMAGTPSAAAAVLARRGTAEAMTAAAQIAAAAAAATQPTSSEQRQLRELSQQLAASADSAGATPVEPTGEGAEMPVVVVGGSPACASAAASQLSPPAAIAAPSCGESSSSAAQQQQPGAGAFANGIPHGAAAPAAGAAVACKAQSRQKQTIPMSQALAMRPWQLPGGAPGAANGGSCVDGGANCGGGGGGGESMLLPGQRLAYSSEQLLRMCGAMACGKAPGDAFVAAEKARARAAELGILLPELPPLPPPEPPEKSHTL